MVRFLAYVVFAIILTGSILGFLQAFSIEDGWPPLGVWLWAATGIIVGLFLLLISLTVADISDALSEKEGFG